MRRLHIVDVFARGRPFTGNPLAVVPDAAGLSKPTMQAIARELNLSETIFFTGLGRAEVRARIFTPEAELPLAGHPVTGGAWVAVRHAGVEPDAEGAVRVILRGGRVRVRFGSESPAAALWMQFPPVRDGGAVDVATAAGLVGLEPAALDPEPGPRAMAAGVDYLLLPLRHAADLRRCAPAPGPYGEWTAAGGPRGIYVFAPQGREVRARMFAPALGVPEDPATGSGAACLGAWLLERAAAAAAGAAAEAVIRQGDEVGRPSVLRVRAWRGKGGGPRVEVGGAVRPFAEGRIEGL